MSEQEKQAPIEQHPDYQPAPGIFDEDDDEPGDEDSAPVPVDDDEQS